MRRLFVAGNWKMHGTTQTITALLQSILRESASVHDVELAVFSPYPFLMTCQQLLNDSCIAYGAQNVSAYADGAYTGEVSASMLKNIGCRYVIIGHSERRQLFAEMSLQITKKCEMAFIAGITPILCVGETNEQRENGETLSVVQEQLAVVSGLKDNCAAFSDMMIAYEPVWAIGTGKTATPAEAQTVHAAIRAQLGRIDTAMAAKTRILYGGSVKPDNASALFAMPDIDGALVGGASLNAKDFIGIALCNS